MQSSSSLILRRRPTAARTPSPTSSPRAATTQLQKPITPDPVPWEDREREEDKNEAVTFRPRRRPRPTFTTLPVEIHLLIAHHLIYPDALSLKHTSRHFYQLVDTGVRLKVEWLVERRLLHLECPSDRRCDLGSDLRFCRGSVKLLMQRRREHIECESRPGLGCLIYGTRTCPHARKLRTRIKKWMRAHEIDRTHWMLLLASLVPLLVGWMWIVGVMMF
ncbi:hypothetical protein C8A05DRAFT_18692 [Staphylotrichum tortipilum]|uniref:F-box domain-containing protein n=1 Tax=Staphylotrichum tortipilum TaxID=2831512 RepID=A0AAN6RQ13_9PEZI|nr:hypothetical protein C8A05DRAFT_18692 [Staphylotrichum longicolle]